MPLSSIQIAKLRGELTGIELKDLGRIERAQLQLRDDLQPGCVCIHPDEPDEEIADKEPDELVRLFGVGDEDDGYSWQQMHRALLRHRKQMATTGSGSLPPGCHPDVIPDRHVSLVFIDRDTYDNAHYNQTVDEGELQELVDSGLWGPREYIFDHLAGETLFNAQVWVAMECYRLNGCYMEETTDHEVANIHMSGKNLPGYSGVAWFGGSTCDSHVKMHTDNGERRNLHSGAWLNGHEYGHNHQEEHRFSGQNRHQSLLSYRPYTSPFVGISHGRDKGNPQWPVDGKTYPIPEDPIKSTLWRKYGDKPVPRPGSDDPTDPTDPDEPRPQADLAFVLDGRFRQFKEIT